MSAILVAVLAGAVVSLMLPLRPAPPRPVVPMPTAEPGWMLRWRPALSLLAGLGAAVVIGGPAGTGLAVVAAVGCWSVIGRVESPASRREREQLARDLPYLVQLLGSTLAAGAAPVPALEAVTEAVPGAASARLAGAAARLRLGAAPAEVWAGLALTPALGPLGRTLARADASGAPVAVAIGRLADELARAARSDVENRARAVGVKAAVPLGLCMLPCFLLLGVVPLAAGLLASLRW